MYNSINSFGRSSNRKNEEFTLSLNKFPKSERLPSVGNQERISNLEFSEQIISQEFNPSFSIKPKISVVKKEETLSSIEYIHYYEIIRPQTEHQKIENTFPLKNHKLNGNTGNLKILEIEKKKNLSSRLTSNPSTQITAFTVNDDFSAIGNSQGIFKVFSIEKGLEYKTFTLKEFKSAESKRSVVSMDFSVNNQFLVAGYENGYIALWNIESGKCLKVITNSHKSAVVAVKFLKIEKKRFELVASDTNGDVYKYLIKDGVLSTSVELFYLFKNDSAVYSINILQLSENERKAYPELSRSIIIGLVCLDYILVCMLEPENRKLFKFERPRYVSESSIPDCSFGAGFIPLDSDLITDSLVDQSHSDDSLGVDFSRKQILLAISWEKYVYVYVIPISHNIIHSFLIAAHYFNNTSIIKMGFFGESNIFFFDSNMSVKVINTSLMKQGEVQMNYESDRSRQSIEEFRNSIVQKNTDVDQEVESQLFVFDKNLSKFTKTYTNTILHKNKNVFVLAKKEFYQIKLLNWKQCLEALATGSDWMDALSLGLDLYFGKTRALPEIPYDEDIRKNQSIQVLKSLVSEFTKINTGQFITFELLNDKTFQERMNHCINVDIEFCIEIGEVDYLLNEIQEQFSKCEMSNKFIEKLEPFILTNKLVNSKLQGYNVNKIVEFYTKNNELEKLSEVLTHLNIESIDSDSIKNLCLSNKLLNPLIYIFSNGKMQDFIKPLSIMYNLFEITNPSKIIEKYDKNLDIKNLSLTKEYIGHKILWFSNISLKGKRYPMNDEIPKDKLTSVIVEILTFIFSEEVFMKLFEFDSAELLSVIATAFENPETIKIMKEDQSPLFKIAASNNFNIKLNDLKPSTIVEYLYSICKSNDFSEFGNSKNFSLYKFIIRVSILYNGSLGLHKNLVIEAAKHLLSTHIKFGEDASFPEILERDSDYLIKLIDLRHDFDQKDFQVLLTSAEISPYPLVKVHLLKKTRNYQRCLEVFIKNDKFNTFDKSVVPFAWINKTLKEFNEKSDKIEDFEDLKYAVLQKLTELADCSIENVSDLVEKWYNNDQQDIIKKLNKVPKLQLKYVEKIIEKFESGNETKMNREEEISDEYLKVMKMHITLLCQYSKKDVLKKLEQKTIPYPIDDCLKICLEYKVYDAAIYIMQITGQIFESMKLVLNILNDIFVSITANFLSPNFSENQYCILIEEFRISFKKSVELCENNSNKIEGKEEDLWFPLVDLLFKMSKFSKEKFIENKRAFFEDFNKKISNELKDIIERMCSYISIQSIMENVSNNYKDAEFKEFKKILLKMLSNFSHQKNLLSSAKTLLSNSVLYHVLELKKLNTEGNKYRFLKCHFCNQEFDRNKDEKIKAFRCGHKYHIECFKFEGITEIQCLICQKNEIETVFIAKESKSLLERSNLAKRVSFANDSEDLYEELRKVSQKDQFLKKLKDMDKKANEELNLLLTSS